MSPFPLKPPQFDPETLHMCEKLSGQIVQYSTKRKFDQIVQFLTSRCWMHLLLSL